MPRSYALEMMLFLQAVLSVQPSIISVGTYPLIIFQNIPRIQPNQKALRFFQMWGDSRRRPILVSKTFFFPYESHLTNVHRVCSGRASAKPRRPPLNTCVPRSLLSDKKLLCCSESTCGINLYGRFPIRLLELLRC